MLPLFLACAVYTGFSFGFGLIEIHATYIYIYKG